MTSVINIRHHRVSYSGVIPSASVEDLGLWLGPQRRCWDDGLRGDPLVPGSWGHSELDALHPDWQENCSCYIFPAAVLAVVSVMCRTVCAVRAAALLILLTGLFFFGFRFSLSAEVRMLLYESAVCSCILALGVHGVGGSVGVLTINPDFLEAVSSRHSLTAAW